MFFSAADIFAVLPEMVISGMACLLLLVDLAVPQRKKGLVALLSVISVLAAAFLTFSLTGVDTKAFSGTFVLDDYSAFFKLIFYIVTVFTIFISLRYLKTEEINMGEYYVLMLFSLSGMMVMASGGDLLTIYLGLELTALPIYALVGFLQHDRKSNEAAMKYVILGAFSSAILLYGISLIYGTAGTTDLAAIAEAIRSGKAGGTLFVVGIIMLVAGFGFKIAGFPFHMWAPDAYEGAPTPITAFMSAGPKAAGFAAFLRVMIFAFPMLMTEWTDLLWVLAVLTMTVGNIIALSQDNVKRMLAYSSIAHAGYCLVGFTAANAEGAAGILFYMLSYAFMNIGAFAVVILIGKKGEVNGNVQDLAGFGHKKPLLAAVLSIFLLSLAGMPPTAGFIGKFYLFSAAIKSGYIWLAIIGVMNSAASLYYYLRVMVFMYMKDGEEDFSWAGATPAIALCLLISVGATLILGIVPGTVLELAQKAVQF